MEQLYGGYTRDQLLEVFNKVADSDNWKGSIQATIPASEFDLTCWATCFFTGGGLEIHNEINRDGEIFYEVFGHGYYVHIGA
tara:strand:- start:813 stop:1058 length:246 start_codon:yes stop_codon:yes gene_type:complete